MPRQQPHVLLASLTLTRVGCVLPVTKLDSIKQEVAEILGAPGVVNIEFKTLEWHFPLRTFTSDTSGLVPGSVAIVRNVINETIMVCVPYHQ
jgi:hypothetical protein